MVSGSLLVFKGKEGSALFIFNISLGPADSLESRMLHIPKPNTRALDEW